MVAKIDDAEVFAADIADVLVTLSRALEYENFVIYCNVSRQRTARESLILTVFLWCLLMRSQILSDSMRPQKQLVLSIFYRKNIMFQKKIALRNLTTFWTKRSIRWRRKKSNFAYYARKENAKWIRISCICIVMSTEQIVPWMLCVTIIFILALQG